MRPVRGVFNETKLHVLQVTSTAEDREYAATTPEQFAENTFSMMAAFPANPLEKLLLPEDLQQLKSAYMPEATTMAAAMETQKGSILLQYTMLWAVAAI